MKFYTTIIAFYLFMSAVCIAATIYVPADQPTIQAGVDAAANGDTVIVAPGTYTGHGNRDIEFFGKQVTLMSQDGPETCIIDCADGENLHRGFHFRQPQTSQTIIDGFTVINGSQLDGAAIMCDGASTAIFNCIFRNNSTSRGGIIQSYNTTMHISDCQIYENQHPTAEGFI